jgi:hypothetical protein
MGWRAADFYAATLREAWLALEGFAEFHAVPEDEPPDADAIEDSLVDYPDRAVGGG